MIAESARWYNYDLPEHLIGVSWKGKYRGQTQKWFALRFEGDALSALAVHAPEHTVRLRTASKTVAPGLRTGWMIGPSWVIDEVEKQIFEQTGSKPRAREGLDDSSWVLIDYGDVVVHIFIDEMRRFYEIERLYKDIVPTPWASAQ